MATIQNLDEAIKALSDSVTEELSEQSEAFKRLEALIVNGGSSNDFQSQIDSLNQIKDSVAASLELAKKEGVTVPNPTV